MSNPKSKPKHAAPVSEQPQVAPHVRESVVCPVDGQISQLGTVLCPVCGSRLSESAVR